jgi:hypothetical protein
LPSGRPVGTVPHQYQSYGHPHTGLPVARRS